MTTFTISVQQQSTFPKGQTQVSQHVSQHVKIGLLERRVSKQDTMPDEGSSKLVWKYSRTTTDVDWITNEAQNKRRRNVLPFEIQHGARSPGLSG